MSDTPTIIQGGMGAGVSNWRLARAVSQLGHLGVVSGTALDQILARRLQDGDSGGHMRLGLSRFPVQEIAERILHEYYIPGGKPDRTPYKKLPLHDQNGPREREELCVVANFVEVFLARQGHDNPVGINYLEKIQIPHLPSLYGAMLAGVGYVLMGAGIPVKIPGVLDPTAIWQPGPMMVGLNLCAKHPNCLTPPETGTVHAQRWPTERMPFFSGSRSSMPGCAPI
jgi:nitronate monooxygenase